MAKSRKRTASASVIDQFDPSSNHDVLTADPPNGDGAANDGDHDGATPRHRIAMRAYELFLARGGADGGDFDDWLAAERELTGGIHASPEDSAE
jgi:hypothetical protein